jgi:hypothetical protein
VHAVFEVHKRCRVVLKPERKWDGKDNFYFKINGRSDSDYAKDTQTRHSISGYIVYLEGVPVMHRSATQKTAALSSCEAELNAAVVCIPDMLYAKNLLELIGLRVQLPIVLEIDNRGTVDLINSFSVGGRTGHIDVKQCFLRELKESKQMIVEWIPGSENNVDMFMKNLDGPLFKKYAEQLLGEGALNRDTPSKGGVRRGFFSTWRI